MKQIRVLQKVKLLGKLRKYNDMITEEEFYSIPPNVRQSLISGDTIEVYDDGSNMGVVLQQLNARVDLLSDVIQDHLGIKLGDYFSDKSAPTKEAKDEESVSEPVDDEPVDDEPVDDEATLESADANKEPTPVIKSEYKKGDTVFFLDDDGQKIQGTIQKIYKRKKLADVEDVEGETWEVSFSDITTED